MLKIVCRFWRPKIIKGIVMVISVIVLAVSIYSWAFQLSMRHHHDSQAVATIVNNVVRARIGGGGVFIGDWKRCMRNPFLTCITLRVEKSIIMDPKVDMLLREVLEKPCDYVISDNASYLDIPVERRMETIKNTEYAELLGCSDQARKKSIIYLLDDRDDIVYKISS